MRKVQFLAVFWTLALAIPFTALGLSIAAYLTENFSEILYGIREFSQSTTAGGRGWLLESAERWPEVAGMIVGQLTLLIILILARRARKAEGNQV
jgi:hypothetical protein